MTNEDKGMVNSIERILNSKIERRTLDGFDYEKREHKKQGVQKSHRITRRRGTPNAVSAQ